MSNAIPSGKTFFPSFSLSDSSRKDLRKVKSACLLALLVLPGILFALPVLSTFQVSASTGSSPVAITGATASIDYPIYASIASATADTRVISITNPSGNLGITTITISIPAGAVKAGTSPSGTIPSYGGVPDCSAGCSAQTFGSGPFSIQYTDTKTAGAVILPGGATISLTIALTPETSTTTTGAADSFTYTTSVTDTTGANTVLNTLTVYMTTATKASVTASPAAAQTAGTSFTFSVALAGGANGAQSGVPLNAGMTAEPACNAAIAVGCLGTNTFVPPTVTPATYTSTTGSQTITITPFTADSETFAIGGPAPNGNSAGGGYLTNATATVAISPGSVVQVTPTITNPVSLVASSPGQMVNMTSAKLIPASDISVSTTDKYGNSAPFSLTGTTTVTLTASSLIGQAAGFTTEASYTTPAAYPYTPSDLSTTASVSIAKGATSGTPTVNGNPAGYYFAPDYGSESEISASAAGLSTTVSAMIVTWTFENAAPTMLVTGVSSNGVCTTGSCSVQAGTAAPIEAVLAFPQANVPFYFSISSNSSGYGGALTSATALSTAASGNNTAYAGVSLTVDPTLSSYAVVSAYYAVAPYPIPQTNSSQGSTGQIATSEGTFASLQVNAYFNAAQSFSANATTTGGTLYLDVSAADAYGNTLTVTGGTLQVTLTTSAGSLSTTTAYIISGKTDTTASGYQVQFLAPSTTSPVTISAKGTYSGVIASGSITINIVSANPTVVFTSYPTSVTKGSVYTISGWANVSLGEPQYSASTPTGDKITSLMYSWNNGAKNTTLSASAAANQFSITTVLNSSNTLTVYAKDSSGNSFTAYLSVPPVSTANTFANASTPALYQFPNGGPKSVNSTFTNRGITSLQVVVIANIFTTSGIPITPSPTATATVNAGATVSTFELLNGLQHGTYTVEVTVYSTGFITLSNTTTITVTV